MSAWQDALQTAWQAMSGWELVAVVLAIAYLLLAMRENILCWYAAFISTGIYLFLFWDVSLLMESALQVYYLAMAVYGWYQWKYRLVASGAGNESGISTWPLRKHGIAISAVLLISLCSGYLLQNHSSAALPFLDSFTTWGAVLTTYMVTKKILENWIYWLVIDGLSIYLYLDRGLYLTALLFVAYLVICVFGFVSWLKHYQRHNLPAYG